MSFDMREGT